MAASAARPGKVVDNTPGLEALLYDGTRLRCERTDERRYAEGLAAGGRQADVYRRLRELADTYAGEIRDRFPAIPRRVSGYNLDSLLPEHGFDLAGLLVGSESTLVTVLGAELALVPVVPERTLVILGYPSIAAAGDAVAEIVEFEPIALEGFDDRLVRDERLKHEHTAAIEQLPDGHGWLLVQFGGETVQEADARARRMLKRLALDEHRVAFLDDPRREDELWRVREGVLSATSHIPGERDTPRAGTTRRSRRSGSVTTCATWRRSTSSMATPVMRCRRSTATSGRGACTAGSRSTCVTRTESPTTGGSSSRRQTSSQATAGACPASTATASEPSCCRGSSGRAWWRRSRA